MAFHPTGRRKERILTFGPFGAGKSRAWVNVAEWIHKTDSDAHVYVIDSDRTVDAYADAWDWWDDVVVSVDVQTWDEYVGAIESFKLAGNEDDWLVIDRIDTAWPAVQDSYIQKVFGVGASSFFLEAKQSGEKGSPLADGYGTNWQVINRQYADFIQPVIRWKGHTLACASGSQLSVIGRDGKDAESPEVRREFGGLGWKPNGQKSLGFQFLSVLLMRPKGRGLWTMSTVKDVAREYMEDQEVTEFVTSYLIPRAGWKP